MTKLIKFFFDLEKNQNLKHSHRSYPDNMMLCVIKFNLSVLQSYEVDLTQLESPVLNLNMPKTT